MSDGFASPLADASGNIRTRRALLSDLPRIFRWERHCMRCIEPANEERWTEAIDRQLELWRSCLGRTQILGVFDGNPALHLYEGRGYRHRGRDGDYLLLGRPVEETAPR